MEEKHNKSDVNSRIIRVKLVDGTEINGQVNINRDPGYDRLSDLLGSVHENFLILYNTTMYYRDGLDNPVKCKTIFINKNHIVYARPDDTQP